MCFDTGVDETAIKVSSDGVCSILALPTTDELLDLNLGQDVKITIE